MTYIFFSLWLVLASLSFIPMAMFTMGYIFGRDIGGKAFKIRAELLWQYLDNIDTLSDIAKGNLEDFYTSTNKIVKKRFDLAYSDGYNLVWKRIKKKEENDNGN